MRRKGFICPVREGWSPLVNGNIIDWRKMVDDNDSRAAFEATSGSLKLAA